MRQVDLHIQRVNAQLRQLGFTRKEITEWWRVEIIKQIHSKKNTTTPHAKPDTH